MTTQEALNRGNNLLAVSISALAGFAFFPEVIFEDHPIFKVDDALLFLLGLGAIVWYHLGNHKYSQSAVAPLFVTLGLIIKIFGVIVEIHDTDDVGDDFGGLILFVAASLLVWFLFFRSRKS